MSHKPAPLAAIVALALAIVLVLMAAGCAPKDTVWGAQPATTSTSTLSTSTPSTPAPTATGASPETPAPAAATPGTPPARPTPMGTPPANPLDLLNIFNFYTSGDTLVKKDVLQLDGQGIEEVVYTVTGPSQTITNEFHSAIGVLAYDPLYREWDLIWSSDAINGRASPLPAANRVGGYNAGDLLRTGAPILVLRTTTVLDGRAHLHLWRWNAQSRRAEPIKMLPAGGGEPRDAAFDADLDVNIVDLNDDGVYEVVADNATSVWIWEWDGSRFVLSTPQGLTGKEGSR